LPEDRRNGHIKELDTLVVKELLRIPQIGLSRATKILHTLYPEIIPMIDNPLQYLYRDKIDPNWTENKAAQLLTDYYNNNDQNSKFLLFSRRKPLMFSRRKPQTCFIGPKWPLTLFRSLNIGICGSRLENSRDFPI